jgi:hypothetical protein
LGWFKILLNECAVDAEEDVEEDMAVWVNCPKRALRQTTFTSLSNPYTQRQASSFVMDVPFISSGAISRAHYAIVRKVETATSSQLADQYLLAEVKSIRYRLAQPGLSMVVCSLYPKNPELMRYHRNYAENAC